MLSPTQLAEARVFHLPFASPDTPCTIYHRIGRTQYRKDPTTYERVFYAIPIWTMERRWSEPWLHRNESISWMDYHQYHVPEECPRVTNQRGSNGY